MDFKWIIAHSLGSTLSALSYIHPDSKSEVDSVSASDSDSVSLLAAGCLPKRE